MFIYDLDHYNFTMKFILILLHKLLMMERRETIAVSNLFGAKTQRGVRSAFSYKRDYYIEIK